MGKRIILFALLISLVYAGHAQRGKVYSVEDEMPTYSYRQQNLLTSIDTTIVYPEADLQSGREGKAYVEFVVLTTAELEDIRIMKGTEKHD